MEEICRNNARRGERNKLSPRLLSALRLVGSARVIVDVGCDHGQFGIAALQKNIAERIIASDISAPSLQKARLLASKTGLEDRFSFRCCSGFDGFIPYEADAAVTLGMGGELIARLIEENRAFVNALDRIVMQPMRGEAELRQYLYESGFKILDEAVVFDSGRYYQLIAAKYSPDDPSTLPIAWPDGYYQFGPVALDKLEPELFPMMKRYFSIIEAKISAAVKNGGDVPCKLAFEYESTKKLLSFYDQRLNRRM